MMLFHLIVPMWYPGDILPKSFRNRLKMNFYNYNIHLKWLNLDYIHFCTFKDMLYTRAMCVICWVADHFWVRSSGSFILQFAFVVVVIAYRSTLQHVARRYVLPNETNFFSQTLGWCSLGYMYLSQAQKEFAAYQIFVLFFFTELKFV